MSQKYIIKILHSKYTLCKVAHGTVDVILHDIIRLLLLMHKWVRSILVGSIASGGGANSIYGSFSLTLQNNIAFFGNNSLILMKNSYVYETDI